MSKQKSGGNKKRPNDSPSRRKYKLEGRAELNKLKKAKKQKAIEAGLKSKKPNKGLRAAQKVVVIHKTAPSNTRAKTFEEDYRDYQKTRGSRGLSPSPDKRKLENPRVLAKDSVLSTGRFPIGELMEKPIKQFKIRGNK